MSELTDWDITAANNNDAPPDGWPESTMQYSEVNNTAREGMAVVARYYQDINGSLQTTGPANAYLVTLNSGATAYFQGMYFVAEFNAESTNVVTINVNGIGVKSVLGRNGGELPGGAIQAGGIFELRYDGTVFQLMGTYAGGQAVVDGVTVRADINTATPPTTEAVTGNYTVFDNDGTDQLTEVGFNGSNKLRVKNFMRAGLVDLEATDAAGVVRTVFSAGGDGGAQLYDQGVNTATAIPVASGGLQVNQSVTASGTERVMTVSDNALKANLASPTLTGDPLAPTPALNDNDTSIATTAFVVAQIANDAPTKTGGGASGNWAIDVTGHADFVAVADESADSSCSVAFFTQATGNLACRTNASLTYDSTIGRLTAGAFSGNGVLLSALNASSISTGTLAVLRGGTGATVVTGSGNNVLSASPTFSGTPFVPSININSSDSTISRISAGNIEIEGRPIISHTDGALPSGRVHVSTSGPSGGANGDIWLERVA